MNEYKDKKVAILGLGVEGITSAQFLHKQGAIIHVLDRRQKADIDQEFISQAEQIGAEFHLGKEYLSDLKAYELIVRSPGIRRMAPQLLEAEKAGVVITSHIKLFFAHCPCPIIGITGTKGKGTTSTLIYKMLKEAGEDAYLGGNIGVPPLTFLDKLQATSKVVLELSSFQLQDLDQSPHIAVMLMVTSEHLSPDKGIGAEENFHEDVSEYVDAKRNILRFQTKDDYTVLNRDYIATNESDIYTDGQVYFVSRERETENGCFALGGKVVVRRNGNDDEIIKTKEIALPGKHNLENVCAAVMAARLAQVSTKHIIHVLKTFSGLEHRLEKVAEVNGVTYYDDSFSTTPETAIAAIEAFEAPKIAILGGAHKRSDFSDLGKTIRESESLKAIIGIGSEWERIKEQVGNGRFENGLLLIENAENMQQIVLAASKVAQKGDVVILSPACSSFDMFKNYKDRGDQFKQAVLQLAK